MASSSTMIKSAAFVVCLVLMASILGGLASLQLSVLWPQERDAVHRPLRVSSLADVETAVSDGCTTDSKTRHSAASTQPMEGDAGQMKTEEPKQDRGFLPGMPRLRRCLDGPLREVSNATAGTGRFIVINYAANDVKGQLGIPTQGQRLNAASACAFGATHVMMFTRQDILDDERFAKDNAKILDADRGGGFWLWKPYIIWRVLLEVADVHDVIMYSDAGAMFKESLLSWLPYVETSDVVGFALPWSVERDWTKSDVFQVLGIDSVSSGSSPQIMGGFSLYKRSLNSLRFISEWMVYLQDRRLATDMANTIAVPQGPGPAKVPAGPKKKHRHDQSVFSLLMKKWGFLSLPDPTQWGKQWDKERKAKGYGQVIDSTRQWSQLDGRFAAKMKRLMSLVEHDPSEFDS